MSSSSSSESEVVKTVLCLAYTGDYLFAGTGDDGLLLRSSNGGFWDDYYTVADTQITALLVSNNKLYMGTSSLGKIYIVDLKTNLTVLSQVLGGSIVSLAAYKNELYAANDNNVYHYNILTSLWDFCYAACGNIRKLKVLNGFMYVVLDTGLLAFDGTNFNLIGVK